MSSHESSGSLTSRFRRRLRDVRVRYGDVEHRNEDLKFRWRRIVRLTKLTSGSKFSRVESERMRDDTYLRILEVTKGLVRGGQDENLIREFASFLYRRCPREDLKMIEMELKNRAREVGVELVDDQTISKSVQEICILSKKLNEWRYRDSIPEYGKNVVVNAGDSFVLPSLPTSLLPSSRQQQRAEPSKQQEEKTVTSQETSAELCRWLVQIAEHHIVMTKSNVFEPEDLAKTILRTLRKSNSEQETQTQLFELLGASGVETMITIMSRADVLRKRVKKFDTKDAPTRIAAPSRNYNPDSYLPRMNLSGGRKQYYEEQTTTLPSGATRRMIPHPKKKGEHIAEEISVPPRISKRHSREAKELVSIDILPEWAKSAFPGVKRLNKLQSALFEIAFNTNENMLVCAPTGAGKTNVAMLTVLREMSRHIDSGVLDRDAFKIIYVAPMKALAQEVVMKFGKRLGGLGVKVRELTGDMQLTRQEIAETNIIVTTPEKWDVITRKTGDGSLIPKVRLLIIDEVHLLADDRGAVIEVLVARTLRRVETAQTMVRLVGLSATLPNYEDVAVFMRVNKEKGLFFADDSFRPVPLSTQFLGVTEKNPLKQRGIMNDLAFQKVRVAIRNGKQVLVFVHSRKDTVNTARALRELANKADEPELFDCSQTCKSWSQLKQRVAKSKDRNVYDLFNSGLGCHHAGMLRQDRNLTERVFAEGAIKVLVCTATLAWGVNLPAHTVIIKGTKLYNSQQGKFVELSVLDVQQIFGRAGRPQYDTSGMAIMITTHDKLIHHLRLMNHQTPIESHFIKALPDHLNAEIVSGTVTNVREAMEWLSYTYLYIRMLKNPMVYGMTYSVRRDDPLLHNRRESLIVAAAKTLDRCNMIRFDLRSGILAVTSLGRTASHYYIDHRTIETFKEKLQPHLSDETLLRVISLSAEFEQLRLRDEEIKELEQLTMGCPIQVGTSGLDGSKTKANILLQTHISSVRPRSFTLVSDLNYVSQNAGRITRGLFEIALQKGWSALAAKLLRLCRSVDLKIWWDRTPLRQFGKVRRDVLEKIENRQVTIEKMRDMSASDLGVLIRNTRAGKQLKDCVNLIPRLEVSAKIQPITRGILRVTLTVEPDFPKWNTRLHGSSLGYWIWVEDYENNVIYHHEYFVLNKKQFLEGEQLLAFTIPVFEPLPPQYYVRVMSNHWMGADSTTAVSFKHLILPEAHPPNTDLLDLRPLPVKALRNKTFEKLYEKYGVFNAVQTQIFHVVYHSDRNILLGAPTGSGKTVAAELSIMRMFLNHPGQKAVYVAPLKALVRERLADWKKKFGAMNRNVVEMTGDFTPDIRALRRADIVITTPEKWDGVSRSWQKRGYVQKVGLVIIDEIHLLGEDRGPVLEVIVSRMRYISSQTERLVRVVGLSTALANAHDLAEWLGVDRNGLFNFRPSVRPVPIEVHISGFPGKHYCPRMQTMNKPTYSAIQQHSDNKPVLVFVASRRQTRLTALELIALAAADNGKSFVLKDENLVLEAASRCKDPALRQTLAFGVGIHHAGLSVKDRQIVEEMFLNNRIQVLVCTATLAWGVNFPCRLVIIKGTEFFDPKQKRYVDFAITDVLQMMGRAGRIQFDNVGVACILVHQPKKNFYRKFLYEPFPVESQLQDALPEHINAEIAGGTIRSREDAVDWLTWTFFFRRLVRNPTYYNLLDTTPEGVTTHLKNLVDGVLNQLKRNGCCTLGDGSNGEEEQEEERELVGRLGSVKRDRVRPTTLGLIASYYYISSKTVGLFDRCIDEVESVPDLLKLLSDAFEYEELPVRHNEDTVNAELAKVLPFEVDDYTMDSPHTKTFLLLQARMKRVKLPLADYANDLKSVLDQALRILNALVDVAADAGLLEPVLIAMETTQLIVQGRLPSDSPLLQLPHVNTQVVKMFNANGITTLPQLEPSIVRRVFASSSSSSNQSNRVVRDVMEASKCIPVVDVKWSLKNGHVKDHVLVLERETEYDLQVKLRLESGTTHPSVLTKSFPKRKSCGWWLVIGYEDELLALKRLHSIGSKGSTTSLTFETPDVTGTQRFNLKLFLIADSIMGVDQEYEIDFEVSEERFDGDNGNGHIGDDDDDDDGDDDEDEDGFWDNNEGSEAEEEEGFWD